ncbi:MULTISPECIES: D-alanyl-D-alanine carboxypeptidase family protein [Rhodanobacter]|uniref:serine-type D-Ala-D-Ala carboxypeptidase n=1 Tax=Rhodanobacter hydrolyticus TaxID=2250595 RepID=A0ABW8J9A3_9GAMM|nr:D-alanyl-D-alanine carboxypeptidase family protein [Rhodanobacter sp. 7MK24]MBD8881965.1 D-alanyl-D-alanine carboxypeptidase [Rhodanobacter sp. 7MK24]
MSFIRRILTPLAAAALVAGVAVAQTPPHPTTPPHPSGVPNPVVAPMPVPPPPDVDAQSWVLMDYATGQILASKAPDDRRPPASLTKVMTDYVVSAEIANGRLHNNDQVTISEHAWRSGGGGTDGSTSFLKLGSQVELDDLLKGMIIQSGNDAAIALAEHAAGSEDAFANLMNAYAKQLGMVNSHFVNASGYPVDDHYSTAHDIAILSRALIHDFPEDYAISKIKEFEWNGIKQQNRNALLWRDPSVDGIKTGHTAAAGFCLDASAKHGDERMIAVVMGASTDKARADAAMALLNYGFRFYETHKLYDASKPLATPRLWKGEANALPIGVAEDVLVTVKTGQYDQLKAAMDIPATLIAPFKKGQQVGTLHITLDGQPIKDVPLVALNEAPQGGFFSRLWDSILLWFHGNKKADADAPAPAPAAPASAK